MGFKFKKEITVGELLTFVSILISAIAFISSWSIDRNIRIKVESDKIRSEAALTLTRLENLENLYISYYSRIDPVFVEASELYYKNFNQIEVRDFIWKELIRSRNEILKDIRDKNLQSRYHGFMAYDLSIDSLYYDSMKSTLAWENFEFDIFLRDIEQTILNYYPSDTLNTADLGNKLRFLSYQKIEDLTSDFEDCNTELKNYLIRAISTNDRKLLEK